MGSRVALGLFAACAVSVALGLLVGRGDLADPQLGSTFLLLRAQRVAVAFLAGAGLAVAGTVVQALFRNPLASPFILGTTSGAALGGQAAMLGVALSLGQRATDFIAPDMVLPFGCVAGAVLSLVVLLSVTSLRASTLSLVLTGFVLSALFLSLGALLETFAQQSWELSRALAVFARGSVSGAGTRQVLLALCMVAGGTLPVLIGARSFDLLLSGEDDAPSLGVDVARVRFWSVIWVAIITAGAVAVGGSEAFVGLIVPHALRPFVGEAHRRLLPAAFVAGGVFLVLTDVVCRALPLQTEVPLSVITSLIGAPIFLVMLGRLVREGRDG
jgi:iron complex transport system permease protein